MDIISKSSILNGLGVRSESLASIQKYVNFLWEANESLNLISRKMTKEELFNNHIIDAYLPLSFFPEKIQNVADFGSGGGIPGVLYALQFPKTKFYLFEKSPKKQEFLRECQRNIAPNLEVVGEISPNTLKGIKLIMARAFKPLDVILDVSREYYLSGGSYFLFKGRSEKIEEELLLAQKKFKDLKINTKRLYSPVLDVERHLVLIGS